MEAKVEWIDPIWVGGWSIFIRRRKPVRLDACGEAGGDVDVNETYISMILSL